MDLLVQGRPSPLTVSDVHVHAHARKSISSNIRNKFAHDENGQMHQDVAVLLSKRCKRASQLFKSTLVALSCACLLPCPLTHHHCIARTGVLGELADRFLPMAGRASASVLDRPPTSASSMPSCSCPFLCS